MKIAQIKHKQASQICITADFFIDNYYIDTRTLKINLKLNNKFLDINENLGKKKEL